MARGVELIDRAHQPDAERGLDLGGLAGLQEPVEPFVLWSQTALTANLQGVRIGAPEG